MKKPFWNTVLGKILKTILPLIIKNQKGFKNTPNAQKVDDVFDKL